MGRMSRNKGAGAERELSKRLTKLLKLPEGSVYRSRQYCGAGGDHGDVLGIEGLHVECKRQEQGASTIYKWLDQAIDDAGGKLPVVITRKNLRQWLLVVELENVVEFARLIVEIVDGGESNE